MLSLFRGDVTFSRGRENVIFVDISRRQSFGNATQDSKILRFTIFPFKKTLQIFPDKIKNLSARA